MICMAPLNRKSNFSSVRQAGRSPSLKIEKLPRRRRWAIIDEVDTFVPRPILRPGRAKCRDEPANSRKRVR